MNTNRLRQLAGVALKENFDYDGNELNDLANQVAAKITERARAYMQAHAYEEYDLDEIVSEQLELFHDKLRETLNSQ